MSDHPRGLGEDSMAPTTDSRDGANYPKGTLPQALAKLPPIERKYGVDARNKPVQQDIEYLCKFWAEVGRAVLMRRRAAP